MELAAALRELGDGTAIIFSSSNREMALRGGMKLPPSGMASVVQPYRHSSDHSVSRKNGPVNRPCLPFMQDFLPFM